MSTQLDALTAQVAANVSVEASAVTMIQGIANQIATAVAAGDAEAEQRLLPRLRRCPVGPQC